MSKKIYSILKWIALVVLPALATLIVVIGNAVGWGWAETVAIIIGAIATFLGTILGVSSSLSSKKQGL